MNSLKIWYSIKRRLLKSKFGIQIVHGIRKMREKLSLAFYSDPDILFALYNKRFGRKINLADPQTYTEKLNWLKLFYRHPDMPVCSDKNLVHDYLKQHGHSDILNEVYGVYKSADDIDFDSLPERFVAKVNHGSSWNIICTDKRSLNWELARVQLNCWLKENCYVMGREWNYRDIPPRIVVEKYIEDEPLIDYKFMCFNGEPLYLQINHDMNGKHYVDFYDITWERMPFSYGSYKMTDLSFKLEKPKQFEMMKSLAKELSSPFPFVRVDFYNPGDKVYFGELTFFPGGGMWPLNPVETKCDELLGLKLALPKPNFNLDLYDRVLKGKK